MFIRFDTIPACDGQTDRQTDRFAVATTALRIAACCKKTTHEKLMQPLCARDGIVSSFLPRTF